MNISVVIPHYKTGKMTAYAVSKFLKHSQRHDLQIVVVDNSAPDRSIEYLTRTSLRDRVRVLTPTAPMQSHGIALNHAVPYLKTEYFLTAETDSFPERDDWLDIYESLIADGYDTAGSLLTLSGGQYIHPAGALYRVANWIEAARFCANLPYIYIPNAVAGEDFKYHLMVHDGHYGRLLAGPGAYGLALTATGAQIEQQRLTYLPICAPFHDGRGFLQEQLATYGRRTIESDAPHILLPQPDAPVTVRRIGYEPGQWFCYWHAATGKRLATIPTETKWLPGRVNQQQEYTLMENGFRHLWGITAYSTVQDPHLADITSHKAQTVESLFDSIEIEDVRRFSTGA